MDEGALQKKGKTVKTERAERKWRRGES